MDLSSIIMKYKIIIGVASVVVLASVPSVYYFHQYQKAQLRLNNPQEAAKQEAKDTVAAVGRLMLLPTDEEPTVMQVSDVSKLKDQPFFAHAMNGDKVLIYTKAKKAILYRTETNKIIDVAAVNIGNTTPTPVVSPSAQPKSSPTPSPTAKPATTSATIKK